MADDGWKQVILEVAGIWKDHGDIEGIVTDGRRRSQERFESLMRQWRGGGTEEK